MERLYQYIWKHKLMKPEIMTVDGHRIEVVYQGRHNTDAGPDFLGARLRIDNHEWAGNVEVHVRASDWNRHHHDTDPAYRNVILHVVGINDTEINDGLGGHIPQVIITFPETFASLYSRMSEKIGAVNCEEKLSQLPSITVTNWVESLAVERIHQKAQRILDTVHNTDGDWQRACFITLARALGFSLNAEPMEMLAHSLPLNIAAKHSDDPVQLEALLLGQAGMLDPSVNIFDERYQTLCREYSFLAHKYTLKPMRPGIWKFARTRPQNFPTRRISLLSKSLEGGFSMLSEILDPKCDIDSAGELFDWADLTPAAVHLLIINFVAPMLYAYGASRGDAELSERGLDMWHASEPENNRIIRQWEAAGLKCSTAADTQGLLQLRKEYCDRNRCMECRFGHALLREAYFEC